jgi:toluene monooxygenase system protein B
MALFPIYGGFAGDFVAHLVAVDTEDTMDVVGEKVAVHAVDRRIPRPTGASGYDVYLDGRLIPPATTLGELGLMPLQWLDVAFRE